MLLKDTFKRLANGENYDNMGAMCVPKKKPSAPFQLVANGHIVFSQKDTEAKFVATGTTQKV